MRMMDELKHMMLYSANKKVYAPIDEKDKRKNSAILLLTPSLEISSRLMKLPYVYNPKLFVSFYVDRNVMAYIDNVGIENVEIDDKEEEQLSEALLEWTKKTKFIFDPNTGIMAKKYVEEVFNSKACSYYAHKLGLDKVPEEIHIKIYNSVEELQNNVPKNITNQFGSNIYSYIIDNNVYLLSKLCYIPERMGNSYENYLVAELVYAIITQYNPTIDRVSSKAISLAMSGQIKWLKDNVNNYDATACTKFAKSIEANINNRDYMGKITSYIKSGDVYELVNGGIDIIKKKNNLNESKLSYSDRKSLSPKDFGIPDKRKYPMPDESHVRAAIKMFNKCDPEDEEVLAKAINKKIKEFDITDIEVGDSNRFKKYYKGSKSTIKESYVNSDYEDILKICSNLSRDEFNRISFYDIYKDSPFVIKRIIHRINNEPVGFLDVYQFPSKPELAQIVIAVDGKYRGHGIAKSMVDKLLYSNLPNEYGFELYYWTAHKDNEASKNLALKNGFKDTNRLDKYGRMIYTKRVKKNSIWDEIPYYLKPLSSSTNYYAANENAFVTDTIAIFNEADDPKYSQKLKKYLYAERIKNNKGVLQIYDKIKETNPEIKYTYLKLNMYKKLNIFVDLSYYHALFLQNNIYKMDKAVNFYFDFLNRLINNPDIDAEYKKKTIFIPIDSDVWPVQPNTELWDFRKNLNPISIIFRLVRTNLASLKKAWGNKDIIFVGTRGYFKIDFKLFELKHVSRLKTNLKKLMSNNDPIVDEEDIDPLNPDINVSDNDISKKNIDTSRAMTAKMVDRIENNTSIKLNSYGSTTTSSKNIETEGPEGPHLKLNKEIINISSKYATENNGVAVIYIDPDGPDGFERLSKTNLSNLSSITNYCMPI